MNRSSHVVTFELDRQQYALPLSAVKVVVQAVEITPLPHAPDSVVGMINFQGQLVPVFNLRRRFGLPDRELQLDDQIILAWTARRLVALVVDGAGGVVEGPAGEPGTADRAGTVKLPEGLMVIHDLDTFLSPDEEQTLEAALAAA